MKTYTVYLNHPNALPRLMEQTSDELLAMETARRLTGRTTSATVTLVCADATNHGTHWAAHFTRAGLARFDETTNP